MPSRASRVMLRPCLPSRLSGSSPREDSPLTRPSARRRSVSVRPTSRSTSAAVPSSTSTRPSSRCSVPMWSLALAGEPQSVPRIVGRLHPLRGDARAREVVSPDGVVGLRLGEPEVKAQLLEDTVHNASLLGQKSEQHVLRAELVGSPAPHDRSRHVEHLTGVLGESVQVHARPPITCCCRRRSRPL